MVVVILPDPGSLARRKLPGLLQFGQAALTKAERPCACSGFLKRAGFEPQYRETTKANQPHPGEPGPTRRYKKQNRDATDHDHHDYGQPFPISGNTLITFPVPQQRTKQITS